METMTGTRPETADYGYEDLRAHVIRTFNAVKAQGLPLLRTNVDAWPLYLENLPEEGRQQHDCRTCRRWFETYGGLVIVHADGNVVPAMWSPTDEIPWYGAAVRALWSVVRCGKVVGAFFDGSQVWGEPHRGGWTHFAVEGVPFRDPLKSADQMAAEKTHEFETVQRALDEFSVDQLEEVVEFLRHADLYQKERVQAPAEWLLDTARVRRLPNVVWSRVAAAPPGFCRPRSTMIGTLLDDLATGASFEDASRRFVDKMSPDRYMRPTAAPAVGNIKRAEEVISKLGIASSLKRRYALVAEVPMFWTPSPDDTGKKEDDGRGVFSHLLRRRQGRTVERGAVDGGRITWSSFVADVLPNARTLQAYAALAAPFGAMMTAEDPESPEIFQWPGRLSWYTYKYPTPPREWGLTAGRWYDVAGVAERPGKGLANHREGALIVIPEARNVKTVGLCLFPAMLKSTLHEVRATIEAHSNSVAMPCPEGAACGILVESGNQYRNNEVRLRVNGRFDYTVDRW